MYKNKGFRGKHNFLKIPTPFHETQAAQDKATTLTQLIILLHGMVKMCMCIQILHIMVLATDVTI